MTSTAVHAGSMECHAPRDKHDIDAIAQLEERQPAEWEHLALELLTWLQDTNWPVARAVERLFFNSPQPAIEPIRQVLQGGDVQWQYYCICLIGKMPAGAQRLLQDDLKQYRLIITHETDAEWGMKEEIDKILDCLK